MVESFYEQLAAAEQSEYLSALCVVTKTHGSAPGRPGMKMLVYEDGSIAGTVGGGAIEKETIEKALEIMHGQHPVYFNFNLKNDLAMECGGGEEVYIEPVNKKMKLYIFGGGHIGTTLSAFAHELGFDITVIDERENIFNAYPQGKYKLINKHFEEAIGEIKFDKRSFFVLVTHKHMHDYDILKLLCDKPCAYLGMIGSKIKVDKIRKEIIEQKYCTEERATAIDMPIGIKFKAQTHKEIAVSILARLIDVRNSL